MVLAYGIPADSRLSVENKDYRRIMRIEAHGAFDIVCIRRRTHCASKGATSALAVLVFAERSAAPTN
jgi:hypothetical protein